MERTNDKILKEYIASLVGIYSKITLTDPSYSFTISQKSFEKDWIISEYSKLFISLNPYIPVKWRKNTERKITR